MCAYIVDMLIYMYIYYNTPWCACPKYIYIGYKHIYTYTLYIHIYINPRCKQIDFYLAPPYRVSQTTEFGY